MRTCIGCRQVRPRAELVRFVANPAGTVTLGPASPGRGAWMCRLRDLPDPVCLTSAVKRRAFGRALRAPVDESETSAIRAFCTGGYSDGTDDQQESVLVDREVPDVRR